MSKKLFTPQEIEQLKQNEYVKSVSEKGVTYTKEFKENFIMMSEKGKFPREIFEYYGFNVTVLGMQRVNSAAKRWKQAFTQVTLLSQQNIEEGNKYLYDGLIISDSFDVLGLC